MNFPLYIAKRYLFSKSSNNAINIITGIAAIGVILGAMSLFIVLSGFSGLKDFSLQFTNVFDADLKIYPTNGKTISFQDNLDEKINAVEGIISYSKIIEERIFLHYRGKNHIAYIKGVDSNYPKVNSIDSILYFDNWFTPNKREVVIGFGTVSKLSIGTYDYSNALEIYVPKPGVGQITDPSKAFTKQNAVVSGIYQVNEELDSKYIFSDINFARSLLKLEKDKISSIEFKLDPLVSEESIRNQLSSIFPDDIIIKNRIEQNDALFKMLNAENLAVYLIFTLVLIIALFNVIGSIIMMILDKRKNIKTLFDLGSKISEIRRIFFLQGVLMTTIGGFIGILLGVIAVFLQLKFSFIKITSSLSYPVKLSVINIIVVFITITVLGIIASKLASSRVREKLLA